MIPDSIGYLFMGLLNEKVKPVSLNGHAATEENILRGRYKITNRIYLVRNKETDSHTKNFIDFVLSEDGQHIIAEEGLIPVEEKKRRR